ncbi:hypothetical protein CYME_CMG071C [Cyanidioschyzon merolae strain 10D]|uniref:Uncharacterized protein n=1 Tax=Cyanidioschyzon merolae (strain NIES-3377 / 10D) TaxID=280699 RepID=M1VG45_CYAM1|nr:hypothetical protein CYME_CMG071C [Cyanidioschyzon merolae strain 10D]BAM79593.1 hypothetical protein CYME_CMG071C [Cyanidioschyzon merolae strain 10D]|eukprot:XP_005535879.1 hypothetical protein CYME_CMG071C [Cyanidioschyzon merolae strain 10D]
MTRWCRGAGYQSLLNNMVCIGIEHVHQKICALRAEISAPFWNFLSAYHFITPFCCRGILVRQLGRLFPLCLDLKPFCKFLLFLINFVSSVL